MKYLAMSLLSLVILSGCISRKETCANACGVCAACYAQQTTVHHIEQPDECKEAVYTMKQNTMIQGGMR